MEVVSSWFTCDRQLLSTCMDYLCWMLQRLSDPFMACNRVQSPEEQKISRWSGFHAITQPGIPAETNIGYHPMVNAEARNFITFDLPLYANAKQLQLKYPEEFKNTVIKIGGFHVALNYLSLRERNYANSGLEDLQIESGVYAAATTSVLTLRKSNNRGIHAQKLVIEALFRLLWKPFLEWLSKKAGALECRTTIKMEGFFFFFFTNIMLTYLHSTYLVT